MSATYLVTGAAGFIAANVVRMLLDAGHEVVGIDNLNDAYDPTLKRWRLAQLTGRQAFRFYEVDICECSALEPVFAERQAAPFAAVVNLAARAGVRPSVDDPWPYFRTNAEGCLNLLDLCRRYDVAKFVLASTSSLYGSHNAVPFREEDDTNRPLSPYAASKKAAEAIAFSYHHLHQIDVSILRYFTVYGPAGRPDMSVFRFVRQIAEGEPITVFGDGTQQRDFTYVDDIARGTIAALKPLGYEVINLGGDRPVELNAVIQQIAELVGRQPVIQSRPAHAADVPATWAAIEKARSLLGWSPQITVEQGLRSCVEWYRWNRSMAREIGLC
ncbi:MAG: NAD-dependent epimerase/dehydratase family protein [Pirellulales bacterium]